MDSKLQEWPVVFNFWAKLTFFAQKVNPVNESFIHA